MKGCVKDGDGSRSRRWARCFKGVAEESKCQASIEGCGTVCPEHKLHCLTLPYHASSRGGEGKGGKGNCVVPWYSPPLEGL